MHFDRMRFTLSHGQMIDTKLDLAWNSLPKSIKEENRQAQALKLIKEHDCIQVLILYVLIFHLYFLPLTQLVLL